MYTVYKITNKITNKSYIGSSISVEKRWAEQKNTAFNQNNTRYNYPLYRAFRKYGLSNFKFEILKDDFSSIEEMTNYEYQMICYYDSYNNGYNQTYQTSRSELSAENCSKHILKISQPCAKVDTNNNILEIYSSYHDATRKNGLNGENASIIRNICKGKINGWKSVYFRDLDENGNIINYPFLKSHGKKSIVGINISNAVDEIYFPSISEASRQLQIPRKSLSACINGSKKYSCVHGYIWREIDFNGDIIQNDIDINELIQQFNEKNPMINGERHNIKEWCNIYQITTTCYYTRRKKGMDTITAITLSKGVRLKNE